MASNGIRDRVAIVGMGCTPFGELWEKGADDLLVDATKDAISSAGVALDDIDAFWLGTLGSGNSGLTLSRPLKIDYRPVTRVENFCATGSEALRNACYAVASGAYDLAMAIGVEKLKDSGYSGLTGIHQVGDGTGTSLTSPAAFSFLAPSYAHKYGVDPEELKEVLTRIAWKNHYNGARNPRAQFRKGGLARDHLEVAACGRRARGLRLQRGGRRLCRRHRSVGPRTPTGTPTRRCT
jgi:acetyl-CoA C-acetyltransferase